MTDQLKCDYHRYQELVGFARKIRRDAYFGGGSKGTQGWRNNFDRLLKEIERVFPESDVAGICACEGAGRSPEGK